MTQKHGTHALIVSGDGLLPTFSWRLARALRRSGAVTDVIGSFHHFRRERTQASFLRHVEERLRTLMGDRGPVVLIGYSFGAVIAHVAADLPADLRGRVQRVVLIAPPLATGFAFRPSSWLDRDGPKDRPTTPAMTRLAEAGYEVLVLHGAEDAPRAVPCPKSGISAVTLPGGHDFAGRYNRLAAYALGWERA